MHVNIALYAGMVLVMEDAELSGWGLSVKRRIMNVWNNK